MGESTAGQIAYFVIALTMLSSIIPAPSVAAETLFSVAAATAVEAAADAAIVPESVAAVCCETVSGALVVVLPLAVLWLAS